MTWPGGRAGVAGGPEERARALPSRRRPGASRAVSNADDLGNQCGGWTITWQGQSGTPTTGTTVLAGLRAALSGGGQVTYARDGAGAAGADAGVVVVGETPYAEFRGDRADLSLSKDDLEAIATVKKAGIRWWWSDLRTPADPGAGADMRTRCGGLAAGHRGAGRGRRALRRPQPTGSSLHLAAHHGQIPITWARATIRSSPTVSACY